MRISSELWSKEGAQLYELYLHKSHQDLMMTENLTRFPTLEGRWGVMLVKKAQTFSVTKVFSPEGKTTRALSWSWGGRPCLWCLSPSSHLVSSNVYAEGNYIKTRVVIGFRHRPYWVLRINWKILECSFSHILYLHINRAPV